MIFLVILDGGEGETALFSTEKKKRRGSENLVIQIRPRSVEQDRRIGDDRSPNDRMEDNAVGEEKTNQEKKSPEIIPELVPH